MKINKEKLANYLQKMGMNTSQFFNMLDLDIFTYLQLSFGGNTLNEESSRKFINAIGADDAMELIDWEAMNVRKPNREQIFGYAY